MYYNDADFIDIFTLGKEVVLNELKDDDDLTNGILRNSSVSRLHQLFFF